MHERDRPPPTSCSWLPRLALATSLLAALAWAAASCAARPWREPSGGLGPPLARGRASALEPRDAAALGKGASGEEMARRLVHPSATAMGYIEGEEIRQVWKSSFIIWSLLIAAFGAYVAFTTTMYMKQVSNTWWYWVMLAQAGLALGVCSIWCMHFVGMQALALEGGSESGATGEVAVTFEPALTITSALAAWLISSIALYIALGRNLGTVSVGDFQARSPSARGRSFRQSARDFWETVRGQLKRAPVKRISGASTLVTLGVCIMHYMGMLSQTGNFVMEYDVFGIVASAIVAAIASFAGLAIFFFLFDSILFRAASAIIVSLAVNGMHYTGMQSAKYYVSQHNGIWGSSTVGWPLPAMEVLIGVLLLNFFLMAATGYYVEVLEMVRKREGEAFEKELRHKKYMQDSKELIQRSRMMRYPMCLIKHDTFVRQGKLVPHEAMRDANRLVYINNANAAMKHRKKRFIVFFSHQWLSSKIPDPTNRQFQDMLAALSGLSKVYKVKLENMYIWVDYSSIPQEGLDQQQLAIDSITTYVSVASAFVIVAPQVLHTEAGTPCNFMTYSRRCWCRLEVFCSLLSTLRHKSGATSVAIPEEDEEEDAAIPQAQSHHSLEAYHSEQSSATPKASRAAEQKGVNHVKTTEPSHVALHEQHRVFLVVDDQLHRLNFFTKEGVLRKEYEELLFVFKGDLECCSRGHIDRGGREVLCDKMKLVPSLCGCYGAMLEDLRRSQRKSQRGTGKAEDVSRRALAEHIVKLRQEIFPRDYFDSRIEAMQTEVERGYPRRHVEATGEQDASAGELPEMTVQISDEDSENALDSDSKTATHTTSRSSSKGSSGMHQDASPAQGTSKIPLEVDI